MQKVKEITDIKVNAQVSAYYKLESLLYKHEEKHEENEAFLRAHKNVSVFELEEIRNIEYKYHLQLIEDLIRANLIKINLDITE